MNIEAFQKLLGHINVDAGNLQMSDWERRGAWNACGTTRCLAGWAIYDATDGSQLYDYGPDGYGNRINAKALDLAHELGVETQGEGSDEWVSFADLGAAVLGLTDEESTVFYTSNHVAKRFVEAVVERGAEAGREYLRANDIIE